MRPAAFCAILALVLFRTSLALAQASSTAANKEELVRIAATFVVGGDICDAAQFLDPQGTTTILATVDYSGRRFCNELIRIKPGHPPMLLQRLGVVSGDQVSTLLRDVDGDGREELVIANILTPYRGGFCAAWYPTVYVCSPSTCAEKTKEFPGFLMQRVGETEAELNQEMGGRADPETLACLTMSRDKLRRLVGGEASAGQDTAQQWLSGRNEILREDGAIVLYDIDNDDARRVLDSLVSDRNPTIARLARRSQQERAKESPK